MVEHFGGYVQEPTRGTQEDRSVVGASVVARVVGSCKYSAFIAREMTLHELPMKSPIHLRR